MTNLFLKVNKDLFKLGLNPTEILVLAQIMEFDTNNKICYMTNEQFAAMLNVSERTISRALNDTLHPKGYITIINPRSKSRSFQLNRNVIEADLRQNGLEEELGQNVQENIDNLSNKLRQFDFIKDNKNIKIKDNDVKQQPLQAGCITLVDDSRSKVDVLKDVINNSTSNQGNFKF